jgi:hypothetical protein
MTHENQSLSCVILARSDPIPSGKLITQVIDLLSLSLGCSFDLSFTFTCLLVCKPIDFFQVNTSDRSAVVDFAGRFSVYCHEQQHGKARRL